MLLVVIIILLVASVLLIWKGSDWVTDSLIPVANRLGTGHIAVTTLLVSAFISIPEVFSSIYSYLLGHIEVGIGVIIGSVMINIGLTVGLSASIKPLRVEKEIAIRDGIFLVVVAVAVLLFGKDLRYEATEGMVLLLLYIPYAMNVWYFEKMRPHKSRKERVEGIKKSLDLISSLPIFRFKPSSLTFAIGAGILVVGSYLFSKALINLSSILPFPEMLTGIVFGGIGTGLPNIVAALQGTMRGYKDAAITETFGSNIFTLLVTLGVLILLGPVVITKKMFYFDLNWMIVIHILMLSFIFKGYKYKEESLTRFEGIVLVLFYLALVIVNALFF